MIEVSKYKCEVCGTEYNDKEKAKKCEMSHKLVVAIQQKHYVSHSVDSTGYPVKLSVKMTDGKTVTYKRIKG